MNTSPSRQTWRRKRNRLDSEAYLGHQVFSVTTNTWQGAKVFTDPEEVAACRRLLEEAARHYGFTILAYCFMPDHVHFLVEGSEESALPRFMKAFKQGSSFRHKRHTGRPLWQRSYYDHIIRGQLDTQRAFSYLLDNPVRAGLVEHFDEYPFLGGAWVERYACGDLKVAATESVPNRGARTRGRPALWRSTTTRTPTSRC